MVKRRLLFVCHAHPSASPGGTENYAFDLYRAFRESDDIEPFFLARSGPPVGRPRPPHPGTPFLSIDDDDHQALIHTEPDHYDRFFGTSRDKSLYTVHLDRFLSWVRPDIIHFQHTTWIGFDAIRQARSSCPTAVILYTLHEFLPICHRDGQMVRTFDDSPCDHASPDRCHACFPAHAPGEFFLRRRLVQSHFAAVDLFLTPSHFLRDRYIAWGIEPERIRYEDNGRCIPRPRPAPASTGGDRPRNRFGFFGQISRYKGVEVLLRALIALTAEERLEAPPHLWLHGSNLDSQDEPIRRSIRALLDEAGGHVTFAGPYPHAQLPELMANVDWVIVPSIWWENAPLVIQEAFMHGRPVLCSDIGGMAEKVRHGVNGLHFRVGDPAALAETMRHAMTTPGLWERLVAGIPPVYPMAEAVASLSEIYSSLLAARR